MQRKVAAILSLKSYPDWLIDYWPSKYLTVSIVSAHTCALVTTSVFLYSLIDFFFDFLLLLSSLKSGCFHLFFWWIRPPFFDFESHWKVVENVVLISFTRRVESFPKCPFFIEQNETLCIFLCYYDFVMLVQLHWSLQQNTRMRLVFQLLYFYLCTKKSWLFNTELLCRICIFGNF